MGFRTKQEILHEKLCSILGSRNCYFQPPTGLEMKYPCIRYEFSDQNVNYADDIVYLKHYRWTLTVIDQDSTSEIPEKLEKSLTYCSFDRPYFADGLAHFVLTLYF